MARPRAESLVKSKEKWEQLKPMIARLCDKMEYIGGSYQKFQLGYPDWKKQAMEFLQTVSTLDSTQSLAPTMGSDSQYTKVAAQGSVNQDAEDRDTGKDRAAADRDTGEDRAIKDRAIKDRATGEDRATTSKDRATDEVRATGEDRATCRQPPAGPRSWQDHLIQHLFKAGAQDTEDLLGDTGVTQPTQEPDPEPNRKACPLLKAICWDHEDSEDRWDGSERLPWRAPGLQVPRGAEKVLELWHRFPLRAVVVSCLTRHVFTCGGSSVRVWGLGGRRGHLYPEATLKSPGTLSHCMLTPDNSTLLVGGDSQAGVGLWDLRASCLHLSASMPCKGSCCQAVAASEDGLAFASFSQGIVRAWDPRSKQVVRDLEGPPDSAMKLCVRGRTVCSGGLDSCLRCWDLRAPREPWTFPFDSQITVLTMHPREDLVLVGTAHGRQWLQHSEGRRELRGASEDKLVMDAKFSPLGNWWASVGTDNLVTLHGMPSGTTVLQVPEKDSVTCCEVSQNNQLLVTGSRDRASMYQLQY